MSMEYIRNIALFLVFVAFMDNVFAFGNMKKYIKLFCGIVLIFILLQPVKAFVGEELNIEELLKLNEIELKMDELKKNLNEDENAFSVMEEKTREIVWEEGFDLTYMVVEGESINISIKERNGVIVIEKIDLDDNKAKGQVSTVKISERIAECFGIRQENVNIYVE